MNLPGCSRHCDDSTQSARLPELEHTVSVPKLLGTLLEFLHYNDADSLEGRY